MASTTSPGPAAPTDVVRWTGCAYGSWINVCHGLLLGLLTVHLTLAGGVSAGAAFGAVLQASALVGGAAVLATRRLGPRRAVLVLPLLAAAAGLCAVLWRDSLWTCALAAALYGGVGWACWSTVRGTAVAPDGSVRWLARSAATTALGQGLGAAALAAVLAAADVTDPAPWLWPTAAAAAFPTVLAAPLAVWLPTARPSAGAPGAWQALRQALHHGGRRVAAWTATAAAAAPVLLAAGPYAVDRAGQRWAPAVNAMALAVAVVLPKLVDRFDVRRAAAVVATSLAGWAALLTVPVPGPAAAVAALTLTAAASLAAGAAATHLTGRLLAQSHAWDAPLRSMLSSSLRFGAAGLVGLAAASAPAVVAVGAAVAAGTLAARAPAVS